jgi:hypothetical protein
LLSKGLPVLSNVGSDTVMACLPDTTASGLVPVVVELATGAKVTAGTGAADGTFGDVVGA